MALFLAAMRRAWSMALSSRPKVAVEVLTFCPKGRTERSGSRVPGGSVELRLCRNATRSADCAGVTHGRSSRSTRPCKRSSLMSSAVHLFQRRERAVVHVRRRTGHVAKRRHLELTEVTRSRPHVSRKVGSRIVFPVTVGAQPREATGQQFPNAVIATLVDTIRDEIWHRDVSKLVVCQARAKVTEVATPMANEQLSPRFAAAG